MAISRDAYFDRGSGFMDSQLDPSTYHDPAEEHLQLSRTTMASALPPGFGGARGTIVRRSTMHGAPIGHVKSAIATRINIDPHIPGQGFVVDMTQCTKEAIARAVDDAGVSKASTLEDLRMRASSAYETFAISHRPDLPAQNDRPLPRESPIPLPGVYVVPDATAGGAQRPAQMPEQPQPQSQGIQTFRRDTPTKPKGEIPGFSRPISNTQAAPAAPTQSAPIAAASFEAPKPSLFAQMSKMPEVQQKPVVKASADAVGPPTYKVTLEIKNSPVTVETWYHDILREEHVLVLCYDTRCVGYNRTKLRPTEEDIAIHIEGSDRLYIVTDPAIGFVYDGVELTILLIKAEHPFQPQAQ